MTIKNIAIILTFLVATLATFVACDVTSEKGIEESLDTIPNLELISGAENSTIGVNSGTTSNFLLNIDNVEWNTLISNGTREGWCIAYKDPISRGNATYEGVGIYSTQGDKEFADVNRLFTMKNALQEADPEITWKEVQIAVWSLLPFQEFDMNSTPLNEMPSYMSQDGEPTFNKEKAQFLIDAVKSGSRAKSGLSSNLSASSEDSDGELKTMCVIATDSDTQTLIVPCDETAFAYGGEREADYNGLAGDVNNDTGVSNDGYAHCFPDDDEITATRWGWTNGLLSHGTYNFPLYAGAGGCNISKGQYAGNVEIVYEGNTVQVTFTAASSFQETHLYVGTSKMPKKKNGDEASGPGQYPNNDDVVSSSATEVVYEVDASDFDGSDIYVVAHAVADGIIADEEN